MNEISLMHGVAGRITAEAFALGGEVSSGGFADVASARHKNPNKPGRSQRTLIPPGTEEAEGEDDREQRRVVSLEEEQPLLVRGSRRARPAICEGELVYRSY
jgi:hypothetical protein